MAANILVKNANPVNQETSSVYAQYERDKYRSVFHLTWKTLFKGLKETAGIK